MAIVIIDYNAGNIRSVEHALHRLGVEPVVSGDAEIIRSAEKVIFPGVGEASTTMQYLGENGLDKVITSLRQPVLGICLGQQLMCEHSEEGNVDCLGIFPVQVKRFRPASNEYKVPHMGWNKLTGTKGELMSGLEGEFVYFVHSYYCELSEYTTAQCDYIHPFSAALQKDNFYATQFHPEKSAGPGSLILKNFLSL